MDKKIRAKFVCTEMAKKRDWYGKNLYLYSYHFNVIVDTSEENKAFFAATPSGEVTLSSVKDDLFTVGQDYYLDFTPVGLLE